MHGAQVLSVLKAAGAEANPLKLVGWKNILGTNSCNQATANMHLGDSQRPWVRRGHSLGSWEAAGRQGIQDDKQESSILMGASH